MTLKSKVFIGVAAIWLAMSSLTSITNCGGNGWALFVCDIFVNGAEKAAARNNNGQFEITNIDKDCLRMVSRDSWGTSGADILVRTNFSTRNANKREPIIVCTQQFGNIPRPTIWNFYHRHLAHAIGYSDGKVGLISPAEFKSLNLSGFTSVSNLVTSAELTITN